ncbi:MAG: succinate--CoA ligase subunit beta, partial [Bdellovibrionales bacterium]|nr:succinate--CoA ligase subunit beta [Bdellovibrionales bacterium]
MNVHEYQAKELMSEFGIKVLGGKMVTKVDDAVAAAKELGG